MTFRQSRAELGSFASLQKGRRRHTSDPERRRREQKVAKGQGEARSGAPKARTEGSQGPVRSAASTQPLDHFKKRESPGGAIDMRAAPFCRPSGPALFFFTIQGLRASRLPLATFCPPLSGLRSFPSAPSAATVPNEPVTRYLVNRPHSRNQQFLLRLSTLPRWSPGSIGPHGPC
jgi:hypothetical protein